VGERPEGVGGLIVGALVVVEEEVVPKALRPSGVLEAGELPANVPVALVEVGHAVEHQLVGEVAHDVLDEAPAEKIASHAALSPPTQPRHSE